MTLYLCLLFGSRALDDVSCYKKTHSLSWFHRSLSKSNFKSILFNRARYLVITCLNFLLTHHIKIRLYLYIFINKKSLRISNSFNEIVALKDVRAKFF